MAAVLSAGLEIAVFSLCHFGVISREIFDSPTVLPVLGGTSAVLSKTGDPYRIQCSGCTSNDVEIYKDTVLCFAE